MKITRFLFLSVTACALSWDTPQAHAEKSLKTDTAGNLTEQSSLNLASDGLTGTLPPIHLGTGTPSSTTVLRGDGAWVGTTPTGNTVAATTNLLLGDGSGNATAVASSADLQRVLKMRADTARTASAAPVNLLGTANLLIRNGTINANGTITIPAHDYVQWNDAGDISTHALRFCYAVATTDQPVGRTGGFYVSAFYNGYNNVGFGASESYFQPAPGVSKYTFTNNVGNGGYAIYVTNAASSPVTIYPPVMTLVDAGLRPVQSFADEVPVASQPVFDLDFSSFGNDDRTSRFFIERQTTVAIDGVNGSDGNPGTLYSPKLTLQQTVAPGAVFGLYRGSVFRGSLPFSTGGTTQNILVQDVALGLSAALPVISALDPVASGSFVNNGDGTYACAWTSEGNVADNGYQNVYVVEINTATEGGLPISSRRRMKDVADQASVATAPGSAFVLQQSSGHWTASIRPTDSQAPGNGSYRYEVVARYSPANWAPTTNLGDGAMRGVELVGSSHGYGSLASPARFAGDRLMFLHATTHNAVIGGGSLQRSVFYEMGDTQSIMLAWYTQNAAGLRWTMANCLFYANVGDRTPNGVISHSSNGANYDRGDISNCAFLGARRDNGALQGVAIDYVNVFAGTVNRVYAQGFRDILGDSMPLATEVKNSVFRQVNRPRIGVNFHDNIVLAESGSDLSQNDNRYPQACFFKQSGASATNNILWARGLASSIPNDDQASGIAFYNDNLTNCTCQRNIIVMNPASTTNSALYILFGSANPATMSIDYNLVINLAKGGFSTQGNRFSWEDYRAGYPNLDQHSKYVDLSGDPRGLKALFVDPLNGDFRWAQTEVAQQCAAYCAANRVGPATVTSHWPVVPTVDQALRLLNDL